MKKPLLTVCIITYNQAAYIRQSLDSILMQRTNFPWEIVVADDCSTDGTRDILQDYMRQHPKRIRLILQPHNVGPEANWLDLLAAPRSKYVLYGEGDDFFTDPGKLQVQVDFLESHPSHAMCFHPVRVFFEHGEQPDSVFPEEQHGFTVGRLLKRNFIQTNSVMYRWQFTKSDIRDDFPKGMAPGDWYLHLYHAQFGRIGFLPTVMSAYRRHVGGLWWDSHKNVDQIWLKHGLAHLKLFSAMLDMYGTNPRYAATVRGHIAKLLDTLLRVDHAQGSSLFVQAVERFPNEVSHYARSRAEVAEQLAAAEASFKKKQQDAIDSANVIASRDTRIAALEEQLRLIKNSRLWRARNTAAKFVGRPRA